ncbi:hypothetical protein U1Q18_040537 [Sarracenia purpurea var. burkii]
MGKSIPLWSLEKKWRLIKTERRGISTEEVQGVVTEVMEKKMPKLDVFGLTKKDPIRDKINPEKGVLVGPHGKVDSREKKRSRGRGR